MPSYRCPSHRPGSLPGCYGTSSTRWRPNRQPAHPPCYWRNAGSWLVMSRLASVLPASLRQDRPAVLIAGQPAARMGDLAGHGGTIAAGCPTVMIGGPATFSAATLAVRKPVPIALGTRSLRNREVW